MAITNKFINIADAIREKTSTTDKMTLTQMPDLIRSISSSSASSNNLFLGGNNFTRGNIVNIAGNEYKVLSVDGSKVKLMSLDTGLTADSLWSSLGLQPFESYDFGSQDDIQEVLGKVTESLCFSSIIRNIASSLASNNADEGLTAFSNLLQDPSNTNTEEFARFLNSIERSSYTHDDVCPLLFQPYQGGDEQEDILQQFAVHYLPPEIEDELKQLNELVASLLIVVSYSPVYNYTSKTCHWESTSWCHLFEVSDLFAFLAGDFDGSIAPISWEEVTNISWESIRALFSNSQLLGSSGESFFGLTGVPHTDGISLEDALSCLSVLCSSTVLIGSAKVGYSEDGQDSYPVATFGSFGFDFFDNMPFSCITSPMITQLGLKLIMAMQLRSSSGALFNYLTSTDFDYLDFQANENDIAALGNINIISLPVVLTVNLDKLYPEETSSAIQIWGKKAYPTQDVLGCRSYRISFDKIILDEFEEWYEKVSLGIGEDSEFMFHVPVDASDLEEDCCFICLNLEEVPGYVYRKLKFQNVDPLSPFAYAELNAGDFSFTIHTASSSLYEDLGLLSFDSIFSTTNDLPEGMRLGTLYRCRYRADDEGNDLVACLIPSWVMQTVNQLRGYGVEDEEWSPVPVQLGIGTFAAYSLRTAGYSDIIFKYLETPAGYSISFYKVSHIYDDYLSCNVVLPVTGNGLGYYTASQLLSNPDLLFEWPPIDAPDPLVGDYLQFINDNDI